MLLITLIQRLIEFVIDTPPSKEIRIKVVVRDKSGYVTKYKYVPIAYTVSTDCAIAIEQEDLDQTVWKDKWTCK